MVLQREDLNQNNSSQMRGHDWGKGVTGATGTNKQYKTKKSKNIKQTKNKRMKSLVNLGCLPCGMGKRRRFGKS